MCRIDLKSAQRIYPQTSPRLQSTTSEYKGKSMTFAWLCTIETKTTCWLIG